MRSFNFIKSLVSMLGIGQVVKIVQTATPFFTDTVKSVNVGRPVSPYNPRPIPRRMSSKRAWKKRGKCKSYKGSKH